MHNSIKGGATPCNMRIYYTIFTFTKYKLSPSESPNLHLVNFHNFSSAPPHGRRMTHQPFIHLVARLREFILRLVRKLPNRVYLPTVPLANPWQMPKSHEHHIVPPTQLYDLWFQPSSHSCVVFPTWVHLEVATHELLYVKHTFVHNLNTSPSHRAHLHDGRVLT